jgi:hypothetical protein
MNTAGKGQSLACVYGERTPVIDWKVKTKTKQSRNVCMRVRSRMRSCDHSFSVARPFPFIAIYDLYWLYSQTIDKSPSMADSVHSPFPLEAYRITLTLRWHLELLLGTTQARLVTLSQEGMARFHRRHQSPTLLWQRS